jgi:hypothetical protein
MFTGYWKLPCGSSAICAGGRAAGQARKQEAPLVRNQIATLEWNL